MNLGPSIWSASTGAMHQSSYIYSEPYPEYVGTHAWYTGGSSWSDYSAKVDMRSDDEHTIGISFRYQDDQNYYRFHWSAQWSVMRLQKVENGVVTDLSTLSAAYVTGQTYQVEIRAQGSQLRVIIDGIENLMVIDNTFSTGSIALQSNSNAGSWYDNVLVKDLTLPPGPQVQPHAVTTAGGNTYSYDANGNMSGTGTRSFVFDHENRLTQIADPGTTTDFTYDADGGRVKKIVNGADTTIYASSGYVCELGSCEMYIMAHGQKIASIDSNGVVTYIHQNHLNSTSVMTDSAGASVRDITYYPYGDTYSSTGTADARYEYTGKEKDDSTGLYFYEARYYDPVLGRFISADTIIPDPLNPEAFNRYTYVYNNPIMFTDPSGHEPFGFAIFAAIASFGFSSVNGGPIDMVINAGVSIITLGVGNAVGGFWGALAGTVTASLVSSAVYKIAGYDVNIGRSLGIAVASTVLSAGVNALPIDKSFSILASGLIGGGMSELTGGDFATGFAIAAASAAIYHFAGQADSMANEDGQNKTTDRTEVTTTGVCGESVGECEFEIEILFREMQNELNLDPGFRAHLQENKHPYVYDAGKYTDPVSGRLAAARITRNGTIIIYEIGAQNWYEITDSMFHENTHGFRPKWKHSKKFFDFMEKQRDIFLKNHPEYGGKTR